MKKILPISDAAALALHTMTIMSAQPQTTFSNAKIASALRASSNHLSKVLQRLAKSGLVRSVRGPKGGFRITPRWERITLLKIYEAMEGAWKPAECLLGQQRCAIGSSCLLGNLLHNMNKQIRSALADTRLSELVSSLSPQYKNPKRRGKKL